MIQNANCLVVPPSVRQMCGQKIKEEEEVEENQSHNRVPAPSVP